ncbi:hypothetical protein QO034_06400 [Sedimentitalea sp. JM2-8]|uniref:Uncharacterized protein n=1 Tax=Sedimentitalea xiamensis TaxID=3050037 RepID=A0ABT7FD35_9RHOB|nr:hypothetical protein [Sedimentitalea xiamensis]MDK3072734.1 hypothetical protein [Sedimentitalea xiamensis]
MKIEIEKAEYGGFRAVSETPPIHVVADTLPALRTAVLEAVAGMTEVMLDVSETAFLARNLADRWTRIQRRCPFRIGNGDACTHMTNPSWSADCEFEVCPFIQKSTGGKDARTQ